MTPIERIIRAEIAATGPMGVDRFMALALGHAEHGYYITRDPLGRDFTTAPEIHQMFGEMIGVWVAAHWVPGARLVELGPGRGTLAADVLRVLAKAGLAPETWLVETSPALRGEQARRVPTARWAAALEEVPEGPMLLLANEFFDALPVKQYLRSPEGWRERQIGLAQGRLAWGLSGALPLDLGAAPWVETSQAATQILGQLGQRLARHGGAALIIDYGYRAADRPLGPTLQALRAGAPVDPLERAGEADLTWLLDFDGLAAALSGFDCAVETQRAFLGRMGIGQRAAALAAATPGAAGSIADALERLTGLDQMGQLFKVLTVLPRNQGEPAVRGEERA
ncbi:MAG: SAM-dependent methyltransferase [Pseudomonadota bacterium]